MLLGMIPVISHRPPIRTYMGRHTDSALLTDYTFSSVNIGDAAPDRLVVVAAHTTVRHNANRFISGATIAGSAATQVATAHTNTTYSADAVLFSRLVTTGTTATITIAMTNGVAAMCIIDVYIITGLRSTTAFSTATNTDTASATGLSASLNIPGNGVMIAAYTVFKDTSTTWTNATEDSDAIFASSEAPEVTIADLSTASNQAMVVETGRSITATAGIANDRRALAVATWR